MEKVKSSFQKSSFNSTGVRSRKGKAREGGRPYHILAFQSHTLDSQVLSSGWMIRVTNVVGSNMYMQNNAWRGVVMNCLSTTMICEKLLWPSAEPEWLFKNLDAIWMRKSLALMGWSSYSVSNSVISFAGYAISLSLSNPPLGLSCAL